MTLEVVLGEDARALDQLAADLGEAGLLPDRMVALPGSCLKSHQPEAPWPEGMTPGDAAAAAARAFPQSEFGVGMLTFFTELNRCHPAAGLGNFGTSAIVHAADDRSVMQTLEALPDVFATAHAIAGDRPLRLGLIAIGMRTNPNGAATMPNPDGERIPMAAEDPRHATDFAARFAEGAWREAAAGGVAELALAMPSGPFGIQRDRRPFPIAATIAALGRGGA